MRSNHPDLPVVEGRFEDAPCAYRQALGVNPTQLDRLKLICQGYTAWACK